MPFRERVKRAFGRSSSTSDTSSSLSKQDSSRRNSNVYQPGEKMPPMKYRRPVEPAHKEKLEAFSFAGAWRRMSHQSQYSPMGSRMPSRRGSAATVGGAGAVGRRSFQGNRKGSTMGQMIENVEDEANVGNVGLSRQHTLEDGRSRRSVASRHARTRSKDAASTRLGTNGTVNSVQGVPSWTQADLNVALKRSHLEVPPS